MRDNPDNMKLSTTTWSGMSAFTLALFFICLNPDAAVAQSAPGGAPEMQHVFDKSTLEDLMNDSEVESLRFYNVKESPTAELTTMVIGVRADGSEVNEGWLARPYKRADGISNGKVDIKKLSCNNAASNCSNVTSSGGTSYCGTFSNSTVAAMLNQPNADGLRADVTVLNGMTTIEVAVVDIEGDSATDLGTGPGFVEADPEPCPNVCGDENNYVNR